MEERRGGERLNAGKRETRVSKGKEPMSDKLRERTHHSENENNEKSGKQNHDSVTHTRILLQPNNLPNQPIPQFPNPLLPIQSFAFTPTSPLERAIRRMRVPPPAMAALRGAIVDARGRGRERVGVARGRGGCAWW
jgi:hypothetical protein